MDVLKRAAAPHRRDRLGRARQGEEANENAIGHAQVILTRADGHQARRAIFGNAFRAHYREALQRVPATIPHASKPMAHHWLHDVGSHARGSRFLSTASGDATALVLWKRPP